MLIVLKLILKQLIQIKSLLIVSILDSNTHKTDIHIEKALTNSNSEEEGYELDNIN